MAGACNWAPAMAWAWAPAMAWAWAPAMAWAGTPTMAGALGMGLGEGRACKGAAACGAADGAGMCATAGGGGGELGGGGCPGRACCDVLLADAASSTATPGKPCAAATAPGSQALPGSGPTPFAGSTAPAAGNGSIGGTTAALPCASWWAASSVAGDFVFAKTAPICAAASAGGAALLFAACSRAKSSAVGCCLMGALAAVDSDQAWALLLAMLAPSFAASTGAYALVATSAA
mmetsp:Transcript_91992/g.286282  ORF Transcript_91992/g.286282 Transcript_91992/m.286282 type:complete len:233 (+) Transcript_91992:889-1587(+)